MTNPFQVTPGPVIFDPGIGGALQSSIAGVIKAMQEREKLEMEKAEFESKQAYFKTLDEGNKLENEQKRQRLKNEERLLQARSQGLDAYSAWVGGGARFEDLGKIVAGIKDPDVAQDFVTRATGHFQTMSQAGQARQNVAEADVAEATTEDKKKRSKAETTTAASQATISSAAAGQAPAQETAQTRMMRAQAALAERSLNAPPAIDPSQITAAMNLYRSGSVTLGEAFSTAGVPLPQGVDPNQKFQVETRGMATYRATQKSAAAQALIANEQLEAVLGTGARITRMTPLKEAVPFDLARGTIPEAEQQMLASGGQFASQYVLSISGKAATDKERDFIMRQILPRAGDKAPVARQKQIMREAMVQVMIDGSRGAMTPLSEIIQHTIDAAKAKGAGPAALQFLRDSKRRALEMERTARSQDSTEAATPLVADTQPATLDSVQAYLNSLGR